MTQRVQFGQVSTWKKQDYYSYLEPKPHTNVTWNKMPYKKTLHLFQPVAKISNLIKMTETCNKMSENY